MFTRQKEEFIINSQLIKLCIHIKKKKKLGIYLKIVTFLLSLMDIFTNFDFVFFFF